jgi:hypothetical protein
LWLQLSEREGDPEAAGFRFHIMRLSGRCRIASFIYTGFERKVLDGVIGRRRITNTASPSLVLPKTFSQSPWFKRLGST